jgi:aminopeptidase YwaD
VIAARRRGAAALLIVADALPSLASTAARVNLVSGTITRGAGAALLAPSGRTRAELGAAPAAVATRIEARLRVDLAPEDRHAANVVAILPGTDPALAGEAVVIGAHYDHLGRVGGTVHPGADDNASGTAVVMGLARAFAEAGGLPRTLVFALFAGEELGLLGSAHYVRQPSLPAGRTMAMLNFDMVGRMRDRTLIVGGVETGSGLRAVVAEAARAAGVNATLQDSPSAASDQASFYSADVPVLFFTTGAHDDYHKPSDTPDKIDAAGLARVAAVGTRVIEKLAEGPRPMYAKVAPPPAHGPRGHDSSSEAFFGISPDLRSPSDGLRLGEIVPGTAAARAGLRDGDVLVRFGDVPMESFEDLQKVLRTKRPGDTVDVVYLRDGDDHTVSATLGARP